MKEKVDLIISINVHEKPEYLFNQILNINEFVSVNKKIILNCNDFMLESLKDFKMDDVLINPVSINKRTHHGSLTQGIISNMKLSITKYSFDYFLVMSSREFFYNKLENVSEFLKHNDFGKIYDHGTSMWCFPFLRRDVKLFQYFEKNNMPFSCCAHEGVCYTNETCEYITNFMDNNKDIESDLYSVNHPVEEFACQSLALNSSTGAFYYIGNGCCNEYPTRPDKLTLKKPR